MSRLLQHLVGKRRVSLCSGGRVLHRETILAVYVDPWRLRVKCEALLEGVLKHRPAFRDSLSRVFLDLVGRMPLHSQQTLHRISAGLLPELVLYLLTDRAHLRLLLVSAALAFTIDLAVCVVDAVGAELRDGNLLA